MTCNCQCATSVDNDALSLYQAYIQSNYATYDSFKTSMADWVLLSNADSATKSSVINAINQKNPLQDTFLLDVAESTAQEIFGSYMGAGTEIMKHEAALVRNTKITNAVAEAAFLEGSSKAVMGIGIGVGVGMSAAKIWDSPTPLTQSVKESVLLAVGTAVGEAAFPIASIVTGNPVTGFAAAAVVSAAVMVTLDVKWDTYAPELLVMKDQGYTLDDAVQQLVQNMMGDLPPLDMASVASKTDEISCVFLNNIDHGDTNSLPDDLMHPKTLWDRAQDHCPLILDLNGDSDGNGNVIDLAHIRSAEAVYWDIDNDGFKEASAWTKDGDGILAIDLDNDGFINNHSELFGSGTQSGFAALAAYDTNADGKITELDNQFGDLLVWTDTNQDGQSQASELHTLAILGITQINLAITNTNIIIEGNTVTQTGTFVMNGISHVAASVNFAFDSMNSVYDQTYTLDYRILDLPTQRGYGDLPDLHIAMSLDSSGTGNLLDKVSNFSAQSFADLFEGNNNDLNAVKSIMFRWASVENIVPGSRGLYVDAQVLAFMEKMMGDTYFQNGNYTNPFAQVDGNQVTRAFELAVDHFYARLFIQSAGKELFTGNLQYNLATDMIEGITGFDQAKLDILETEAAALSTTALRATLWDNVVRMIEYSIGVDNLSSTAKTALNTAIHDSDPSLTLAGIVDRVDGTPMVISGAPYGTSADETFVGDKGDDSIYGYGGDDIIKGGAGNDILDDSGSSQGNDILIGGTGNDQLYGGYGNDRFIYAIGDGNDTIEERYSGTDDRIVFGSGITAANISFVRTSAYGLDIIIGNGVTSGNIHVNNQFSNGYNVEKIQFDDGSTLDLLTQSYTLNGTAGNDTFIGVQYGGAPNDIIYGGDGSDNIQGREGNDLLYGDAGNDILYGEQGDDTVNGGDGNDTLYGDSNGTGNDTLDGGAGDDVLNGGAGNDVYRYQSGNDVFTEGGGTDVIELAAGYTASDLTFKRYSTDQYDLMIEISAGNSIRLNDHFYSATYGFETLKFADNSTINLLTQSYITYGTGNTDSVNGITINGSVDDTIYAYEANDTIYAGAGDDAVDGGGGNDLIYGGAGHDVLSGGQGNDTINGEDGNDILNGGDGDDTLNGGAGNDTYMYQSGNDLFYDTGSGAEIIQLASGITLSNLSFTRFSTQSADAIIRIDASNSIIIDYMFQNASYGIETLKFSDNSNLNLLEQQWTTYGTSGNDTISGITVGGSINDIIYGLEGNDTLNGGTGNDKLDGGAGGDTLNGAAGDDIYVYSSGLDTVIESAGVDVLQLTGLTTISDITTSKTGNNATIVISSGVDQVLLQNQHSTTTGLHVETIQFSDGFSTTLEDHLLWVRGTTGNDTMTGTANHDTLIGLAGNDTITSGDGNDNVHGGIGNDILYGGIGNDLLHGGEGNDTLYGQAGNDILIGGTGADIYVFQAATAFSASDIIQDFHVAENDTINVSDVLTGYTSGTSNIDDFVSFTNTGGNSIMAVDRDGAGSAYSFSNVATINSVTNMDAHDLLNNGHLVV
jgi:Ca2+-binding RTX toxin-like protein